LGQSDIDAVYTTGFIRLLLAIFLKAFAFGEFLSFASPKERNQRQSCGTALDSFSWSRRDKSEAFTKGDPGSLESPQ
jgi:hypothetical protein